MRRSSRVRKGAGSAPPAAAATTATTTTTTVRGRSTRPGGGVGVMAVQPVDSPARGGAHKPTPPPALPPSLRGEWGNLLLLTGLYTLQGIPIGLASSVPLFLQARGASFADQASFGLSSWPYSLKLLWAPIVDALYTRRLGLGLRKSWIVPVQFVTGITLLVLGTRLNDAFGGSPETAAAAAGGVPHHIDVVGLTAAFFVLYFLVATQDIAVDGWALTMLRPENVGYASTANTVGQTLGITLAYGLLMGLDSPGFSNAYVRAPLGWPPNDAAGVVTMAGFMQFWGCVFIAATLALWAFKREEEPACSPAVMLAAHAGAPAGSVLVESGEADATVPVLLARQAGGGGARPTGGDGDDGSDEGRSGGRGGRREQQQQQQSRGGRAATPPHRGGVRRRTPPAGAAAVGAAAATSTITLGDATAAVPSGCGGGGGSTPASLNGGLGDDHDDDTADVFDEEAALTGGGDGSSSMRKRSGVAPLPSLTVSEALRASYRDLWRVACLPSVRSLVLVLITAKAGFSVTDAATSLVVQSRGVPKETIALLDVVSSPLQLFLQLAVSRATAGPRPLSLFMRAYPLRIACGLAFLCVAYGLLPGVSGGGGGGISTLALVAFFALSNAHALVMSVQFLSQVNAEGIMGG